MEVKQVLERAGAWFMKYRYAVCVLLVGILLMLIPGGTTADTAAAEPESQPEAADDSLEERLSAILSKIHGAGRVELMLSYARGEETVYHENRVSNGESDKTDTVILTDGSRNENALITRVDPPEFLGAIVVCQGADNASVRLSIVEAVSKYTGLGADQIAVLKMK